METNICFPDKSFAILLGIFSLSASLTEISTSTLPLPCEYLTAFVKRF